MPHGRIRNTLADGDSRIAVADRADTTLQTTRTRRHSSGAPSTSSDLGQGLVLERRDLMQPEDRQTQAPLVRTWQRCRETPTDNCVWEELFQQLSPALGGIISRTMRRGATPEFEATPRASSSHDATMGYSPHTGALRRR